MGRFSVIGYLLLSITVVCAFRIPLLFGDLNIDKGDDGNVKVNLNSDVSVRGSGAGRNTTFTFGNGTFVVNDDADVRVNGTSHGGSTQFGFDKNGIIADGNITAANKSIPVIGNSRGSGLLSPLFDMFGRRNN